MANLKRTRNDILESVLNTVHRKGLNATGLNELFALSGASSGSFYNYFRSKHELGHALIDFEWTKLQASVLEPAVLSCDDPIGQVFQILDRLEAKQIAQPNCAGCLLGNLIVDLVEQDVSFREHLARVFDQWEQVIACSLHDGRNQLKPDAKPNLLAEQLVTLIEGVLLMGRLHHDPARIHRGFDSGRNLLRAALRDPAKVEDI